MSRLIVFIVSIFFLNQCTLSNKISPWKNEKKEIQDIKITEKVLSDDKKIITEFNQDLKLDFSTAKTNNNINNIRNNFGFQNYDGLLNKIGNYKFAKLENINQLNFKPVFLNDGLIFFDKKGTIIRYADNQKILWKKNLIKI